MDKIALDTTFLIDLQNDRTGRRKASGAMEFLHSHRAAELFLPAIALGEFLEGFEDSDLPRAMALIGTLQILEITSEVARVYAATTRQLRRDGRLIGTNDLWIGCTARVHDLPLVTRNTEHFSRLPGLTVIDYAGR